MKPIACRYAIVQFVPYTETGEFANVGVVLACPATGYFDFRLQTRRYGRITGFFDELHRDVYLTAIKTMQVELERIQRMVMTLPVDERRADMVRNLLGALTHPREAMVWFGPVRPLLTADTAQQLTQLFDHYVDRAFATPEYVEPNHHQTHSHAVRRFDSACSVQTEAHWRRPDTCQLPVGATG